MASNNIKPDVICLQEIWQISDANYFTLPGFHPPIIQTRSNYKGGGVAMYIKNSLTFNYLPEFSIFSERLFESIMVEIVFKDNKRIAVGTVYRPGTPVPGLNFTEQFSTFSEHLTQTLTCLNEKYERAYIYGDINLDVL